MVDLMEIRRAGGLAAVKTELAKRAPRLIAEADATSQGLQPAKLARTVLAAVCAGDQAAALRFATRLLPDVPALAPLRVSFVSTLADYCRGRGLAYTQVLPSLHVDLEPSSPYSVPFVYDTEPVAFASIPGAQYVPGWDFVIGKDDTVLLDSGYMPLEIATHDFMTIFIGGIDCLVHYAPAEETYVDEDVLFLSAPWNSVGHWMIDFLPRLAGLRVLKGCKIRLVMPADAPARYHEFLAFFGIEPSDVLLCAPGKRYRFRWCHVYKPGRAEPPNPKHVRFVREGLTRPSSGSAARAIRRGKRVFLGRGSVGTRMIANAAEFQDFLAAEGFIAVDPADVDIAAQKDLLSDAEIILGPFGSNLFGMYFAPEGCHVIAMTNNPGLDPIIAPTAAILGLRHQYFICPAAPQSGRVRHKKDTDIVVDCAALAQRLAEIG